MEERVFVVDASTSSPSLPLTMKQILMPCFLQTQQFCVDLATDADVSEPASPVMKLHPIVDVVCNNIILLLKVFL